MKPNIVARLRYYGDIEAADRIEELEKALRRLVSWGAACPTEREDCLSHAAEGTKAFHAARAALGENVND